MKCKIFYLHFHKLRINHSILQNSILVNIFLKNDLQIYLAINNFLNFIDEVPFLIQLQTFFANVNELNKI